MNLNQTNTIPFLHQRSEMVYLVRDDSIYCTRDQQSIFVNKFCNILQKYVTMRVKSFKAALQVQFVEEYIKYHYLNYKVISLDKWFKGDFNLDISRVFERGVNQKIPLGFHIANLKEFKKWLTKNKNNLIIIDDDIASGSTIKYVQSIIAKSTNYYPNALSMEKIYHPEYQVFDIVDIRDFIPRSTHGGLLCKVQEGYKRFPYYHPDVDLVSRMKLNSSDVLSFTNEVKRIANYVY